MRITVRLFALYREQAGTPLVELVLPPESTVADAVAALLQAIPALPRTFQPHLIAVNEEFANVAYPLGHGDEVSLYPPVSGGIDVAVVDHAIDTRAVAVSVHRPGNGAIVTFEGVTRNETGGRAVLFLEYEAHVAAACRVLAQVLQETLARFRVAELACRHRVGRLEVGETSLVVSVGAPHRLEAYLAAQHIVDRIKRIVPIWKKEHFANGSVWVGTVPEPVQVSRGA